MLQGAVAFTGRLAAMSRREAFALVQAQGGTPCSGVTRKTAMLVVGALGWPLLADGRPSRALVKAKAYGIEVASERALLGWIGRVPPDGQARVYSRDQLATLSKTAPEQIDQFVMFGLLEPRGDLFGFRDLAAARQITGLLASGVTLSTITESLAEIRKWLPEAGLANLRLHPEAPHSLLVEHGHGRTNKKGQFVLPIEPQGADADAIFEKGQAAEEDEDWENAERLYRLVMKLDPAESAAAFNLGNILRDQNKFVEAEAAYREAVARDPEFAEAWFNLAGLLEEQRRAPEAVRCLEYAIKADPDYADAVFNLALLLQRLERPRDAAALWKRYLDIDRATPWAMRARKALKYCEMQLAVL